MSSTGLMVVASLLFATMGLCVRLAATTYTASEIVCYRGLICMAMMWALARKQGHPLGTRCASAHIAYGITAVSALSLYFYSIAHLPLATAVALNYTSPVWIGLILLIRSACRVHSLPNVRLLSTVVLGLLGAFLILRPDLNSGHTLISLGGLMSGLLAAVSYMQLPSLCRKGEPEVRIVFYFSLGCAIFGGLNMITTGASTHSGESIGWLLAVGLLAATGQWALTRAYSRGSSLTVACLQYTGIVFAYAYGLMFFAERLDSPSMAGAVLVVVAGLVATRLKDDAGAANDRGRRQD